ncbi:MAG TPA: calcium-binding protein [Allosphingosinicella sp.]
MATINGTSGDDTLNGTSSSDFIFGFGGNDILNGNGGNDQLDGGIGADTMSGGIGSDIYFVDDVGDVVTELSGQGNDEVRTTLAAYALTANVEKLRYTGSSDFTGTGNDLSNEIRGAGGNDVLSGGDGWDTLLGFGGDDTLTGGNDGDVLDGGTGMDTMEGNAGDDVYVVDNAGDIVVELASEGVDQVYSNLASYTLGANVENLSANIIPGGSFTGTGNSLDNVIYGGGVADSLSGLDGNDTLRGQGGDDALDGGNGDDLLIGGSGADTMTGGADADNFRIGYYETGTGSAADRITDFEQGTDLIDISGWDANTGVGGDQAFSFVGSAAFSGTAGELRADVSGGDTVIEGDINGDSVADFQILLTGNIAIVSSDFTL